MEVSMRKRGSRQNRRNVGVNSSKRARVIKLEEVQKRESGKPETNIITASLEGKGYTKPEIALISTSTDKAKDYLTAIGFSEAEAGALRDKIKVLPLDGELVALCNRFVEIHSNGWNHNDWLTFVDELGKKGYNIASDYAKYFWAHQMVGTILETLKANMERETNIIEKAA